MINFTFLLLMFSYWFNLSAGRCVDYRSIQFWELESLSGLGEYFSDYRSIHQLKFFAKIEEYFHLDQQINFVNNYFYNSVIDLLLTNDEKNSQLILKDYLPRMSRKNFGFAVPLDFFRTYCLMLFYKKNPDAEHRFIDGFLFPGDIDSGRLNFIVENVACAIGYNEQNFNVLLCAQDNLLIDNYRSLWQNIKQQIANTSTDSTLSNAKSVFKNMFLKVLNNDCLPCEGQGLSVNRTGLVFMVNQYGRLTFFSINYSKDQKRRISRKELNQPCAFSQLQQFTNNYGCKEESPSKKRRLAQMPVNDEYDNDSEVVSFNFSPDVIRTRISKLRSEVQNSGVARCLFSEGNPLSAEDGSGVVGNVMIGDEAIIHPAVDPFGLNEGEQIEMESNHQVFTVEDATIETDADDEADDEAVETEVDSTVDGFPSCNHSIVLENEADQAIQIERQYLLAESAVVENGVESAIPETQLNFSVCEASACDQVVGSVGCLAESGLEKTQKLTQPNSPDKKPFAHAMALSAEEFALIAERRRENPQISFDQILAIVREARR